MSIFITCNTLQNINLNIFKSEKKCKMSILMPLLTSHELPSSSYQLQSSSSTWYINVFWLAGSLGDAKPGFKSQTSCELWPWCFKWRATPCVYHPLEGCKGRGPVCHYWSFMDIKKLTMSFMKSWRVIANTLNELQIPSSFSEMPGLASWFVKDLGQKHLLADPMRRWD